MPNIRKQKRNLLWRIIPSISKRKQNKIDNGRRTPSQKITKYHTATKRFQNLITSKDGNSHSLLNFKIKRKTLNHNFSATTRHSESYNVHQSQLETLSVYQVSSKKSTTSSKYALKCLEMVCISWKQAVIQSLSTV